MQLYSETLPHKLCTSFANSPCDSIGGTVKRRIPQASLQISVANQILTFKAVEEFCKENIVGITFFSIYKKDMVQVREVLDSRYSQPIQCLAPQAVIILSHYSSHQLRESNSEINMCTLSKTIPSLLCQ